MATKAQIEKLESEIRHLENVVNSKDAEIAKLKAAHQAEIDRLKEEYKPMTKHDVIELIKSSLYLQQEDGCSDRSVELMLGDYSLGSVQIESYPEED